jgi:uncharacterized YccA/Bax inhibitor family protein
MTTPVFKNTDAFQPEYRGNFGVQTSEPMTYEGTAVKTVISFVTLLAGAAVGVFFMPVLEFPVLIGLVVVGLALGLFISFKQVTNPAAILAYSGVQGVLLGAISAALEVVYPGIVSQAVLATLSVFTVVMFLSHTKIFRTSPKLNKIFYVATIGYILFSLVNVGLMLTGISDGAFGLRSDLGFWGIAIGVLGALLASYSLVMDYEFIENGVRNHAEKRMEWLGAFGIIVSLVWLYIEILRLLALARR